MGQQFGLGWAGSFFYWSWLGSLTHLWSAAVKEIVSGSFWELPSSGLRRRAWLATCFSSSLRLAPLTWQSWHSETVRAKASWPVHDWPQNSPVSHQLHSINWSKSQGQLRFKGWGEHLYCLVKRAQKLCGRFYNAPCLSHNSVFQKNPSLSVSCVSYIQKHPLLYLSFTFSNPSPSYQYHRITLCFSVVNFHIITLQGFLCPRLSTSLLYLYGSKYISNIYPNIYPNAVYPKKNSPKMFSWFSPLTFVLLFFFLMNLEIQMHCCPLLKPDSFLFGSNRYSVLTCPVALNSPGHNFPLTYPPALMMVSPVSCLLI